MESARASAAAQPRESKRASLSLLLYLLGLTALIWLLIRYGLRITLTQSLARVVTDTGAEWVMYVLIALSVLSVGVMLERWLYYRRRAVDLESAAGTLPRLLSDHELAEAQAWLATLCGMEGRVTATCLQHLEHGSAAMQERMLAELSQERLKYEKNLSILGTLGNNAPFIGLFGTVLGIIKAFVDLSDNVAGGAATVMAGISEALVATAIGLLVAIPCVVAYNALTSRVKTSVANTETLVRTVLAYAQQVRPVSAPEGTHGL